MRILIVADDLTGALDSAVAFADRGLEVLVLRDMSGLEAALARNPDVLALATGTRELTEAEAIARLDAFARPLAGWADIVFKKVDSRLKGHVVAELNAMARLFGFSRAIVAPAIPDFGRVHRNGLLEGSGIATPVDIAAFLAGVGLSLQIPDISEAADFDAIFVGDLAANMLVGARGLAGALAERVAGSSRPAARTLSAPVILSVGSRDPITLAQVALLHGGEDMEIVHAPNGEFAPPRTSAQTTLIQMTPGASQVDSHTASTSFARGLAAFTQLIAPATIIASGGETANSLLAELDVALLAVQGELLPGIPLSRFDHDGRSVALVTKSGGFGTPNTFLQLLALVR